MMSFTLEQKFKALCRITRAAHFEWRETLKALYPEGDVKEAVLKYWEIVGHDTAKAYLKRIDPSKPITPQVARCIVESSLAMGEDASFEQQDEEQVVLTHAACPWYEWHKKHDALEEDRQGCDLWLRTVVHDINAALGTRIAVETVCSLPDGADRCTRILKQ